LFWNHKKSLIGRDYADIDECAINNGGCEDGVKCYNTEGSFSCNCPPGYTGEEDNCKGMSYFYM